MEKGFKNKMERKIEILVEQNPFSQGKFNAAFRGYILGTK